jgi:hypothetical protein
MIVVATQTVVVGIVDTNIDADHKVIKAYLVPLGFKGLLV